MAKLRELHFLVIFKAMVCHMYGNYFKTKSEIMTHYQKDHINIFHSKWDILGFQTIVRKKQNQLRAVVFQINQKL